MKWCYSTHSKTFHGQFDSREQALDDADGAATDLGRCKPLDLGALARQCFPASDLGEMIGCQLSDIVGDYADDAFSFQDFVELEASIVPIVTAFLEKHVSSFYEVVETEDVLFSPEQIRKDPTP
jgi:hypothetical protein